MTPEQAYNEIVAHLKSFHLPSMHVAALAGLLLTEVVTPAIRAAVEAEREACAIVCKEVTTRRAVELGLVHYGSLTGYLCVDAIRARGGHADG